MNNSICECCSKNEGVETITLCNECFNKVTIMVQFLLIENTLLKTILEKGR